MKNILASCLFAIAAAACGGQDNEPAGDAATDRSSDPSIYAAAVANPARPEADRARDADRKPAEVLEFFGIAPGMTVLDMFSGGGYYAEILAELVGPEGHVVAHANEAFMIFVGDEFEARYADNRLPNVEVMMAENNEWELGSDRFDAIMLILSFHDGWYESEEYKWQKIDVPALHAKLYAALKPGGVLAVIDHRAEPGSPPETGGTLHRIDRAIVVERLEAAGFVLEDENDILRNPDDDYSVSVFDSSIRGKTDRFMLKFRKPEA